MGGRDSLEEVAEMDLPIQTGAIWSFTKEGHLLSSDLDHVVAHCFTAGQDLPGADDSHLG